MKIYCKKPARGFVLIEALVAMLVVSFGMLSVAGFQITLSLNSDVAKQRTEATRLAQQKLEQLRTFNTLTAYGTKMVSSTSASPATQETMTTNTSFTRSWAITNANTPDTGRSATVTVAWTDRAGNPDQVQLFSHISATDPLLTGSLFFPLPDGTILRRPKNRSIDIPIPAISINATGKSYIPWSGTGGGYLVFSDNSGDIVQKCNATPTVESVRSINTDTNTGTCVTFDGYLLTGYITGTASKVALVTNIVVPFENQYVKTGTTPECSVGPAYDQTASTPTQIADTKYYVCLIQPTDHDTNASTARVWSGRVDLAGATSTSLAGNQVCRFSTAANTTVNNNHPATYLLVDRSLDNQNFYISSGNCADASASRIWHYTYTGTSTLSVIYNGNGNTGGTVPTDNHSYASGAAVPVQSEGTLVKSDFTFTGWNTMANGYGASRAATSTFLITDDTTLYALWTSTTTSVTHTVTYNSNGGTGTIPQNITYKEDSTVTVPTSPSPTRSGYTFSGWSLSTTSTTVPSFVITADTTLYAQWRLTTPTASWGTGGNKDQLSWSTIANASTLLGYKVAICTSPSSSCVPAGATPLTLLTFTPTPPAAGYTTCVSITATNSSNAYPDSIASTPKCVTGVQGPGGSGVNYTYQ